MIIYAENEGVAPETDISQSLNRLLGSLALTDEPKTLYFQKGDYYIYAENCPLKKLFITNTTGDREFSRSETPHLQRIAFYMKGVKNLTIEGNGARFIIFGTATNFAMEECENIELRNFELTAYKPDLHKLYAVNKTAFYADFEADSQTDFEIKHGALFFTGRDYFYNALKKYRKAWHIARIDDETPQSVCRNLTPLRYALGAKALGERRIRIYFPYTAHIRMGSSYYLFDSRRHCVGIFSGACKNISLSGVAQRFNCSLAFVAQDTENIKITDCTFAPEEKSELKIASLADFIQICMCRGKVEIKNNYFSGACDDCLNVHGMHLKIKNISDNTITVSFMHPQSHGYNAFHPGDEIAFIDAASLLEQGRAKIISGRLLNEMDIELVLDNAENARTGYCVENITACPDVEFCGNTVKLIITRGLLLTTRGKVLVSGNFFESCSMAGILLSDDASSWYESGPCEDVTIDSNRFMHCGDSAVLIKPENKIHKGAVHKNITIKNNEFADYKGAAINASSAEGITISGNSFANENKTKFRNCKGIHIS